MTATGAAAVVVAAGRGDRLGHDAPKALVRLAGRPLLVHALERLRTAGLPPPVVVHPPGAGDAFVAATGGLEVAAFVPGGDTRTASVRAGVAALDAVSDLVAIHDAARPLTPPDLVRDVVAAVRGDVVAAAPGLPVPDSLKRVAADGTVTATVDRDGLRAVQTPQVFRRDVLVAALVEGEDATDDLALVERLLASGGATGRVVVVRGAAHATKVTFPDDLTVAAALLEANA